MPPSVRCTTNVVTNRRVRQRTDARRAPGATWKEGFCFLAHRALTAEPDIGLLPPCNVVVRQEADGRLVVGFMDPVAALQLTAHPEVAGVAKEVRGKLQRVRAALDATPTD